MNCNYIQELEVLTSILGVYQFIFTIMGLTSKVLGSIAKFSANRPIHVIITIAILASISYLSIVNEYIPEFETSSMSYYHGPGDTKFNNWIEIDNLDDYQNINKHLTLVPFKFRKIHNDNFPEIENALYGINNNERFLIIDSEQTEDTLKGLDTITHNGITWKIRNSNRLSHYFEYLRFAILKVKFLIQGAETFDVGLITFAYIAMWYTLIKVFFDMKQAGSNFWLGFSTLISSTFAFLFALITATKLLNIKVSLISMSEGLPFLVAIIGFKHKVSIATLILQGSTSKTDVREIVTNTITSHTVSLLRDHVTVIGALLAIAGYASHLEGLKNFSVLASLILAFDLLLNYTFFAAILTLKVEINRARLTENLKRALEEDGISSWVTNNIISEKANQNKVVSDSIFDFENTSILSFKLAMIAGFFGFHIFWIGSSWLYNSANDESSTYFDDAFYLSKNAAKHIPIGPNGTVVTVLEQKLMVPLGAFVKIEELIFGLYDLISTAIRDNMVSKLILFGFVVSICINAYLLNASRHQMSATNKLLEHEISRPKERRQSKSLQSLPNGSKDDTTIGSETEDTSASSDDELEIKAPKTLLPLEECIAKMKEGKTKDLSNEEVSSLVSAGKLPLYALEKQLADNARAVVVRRKAISKLANAPVLDTESLPHKHYDYDRVFGACCENVIGYMPLPVGIAGPLIVDGKPYHIPMATTEGCLVASAMRGCKAINSGGGTQTVLTHDGMSRGPCVSFPSLARAGSAKIWLDSDEGQKVIKKAFNSTSRFARLQSIKSSLAGTLLYIRFVTTTGDAMGMNMISKGVEHSLAFMRTECGWDDMEVISVSGNFCIDKKPAALNWIEGRGKSVVAEARIPGEIIRKVLKSDVKALVELNIDKNLVGSAMAGSVGGFNAQAANLVTAVFLACGQDPAQNVESSNCITLMKEVEGDLQISVSMPSIEVGTIGGGTILKPQSTMLELLGVRGPHPTNPGENARQLARIIASIVLAAELSLCSALAAGHLVQSHMQHNRAPKKEEPKSEEDIKRLQEGSVNCIRS